MRSIANWSCIMSRRWDGLKAEQMGAILWHILLMLLSQQSAFFKLKNKLE